MVKVLMGESFMFLCQTVKVSQQMIAGVQAYFVKWYYSNIFRSKKSFCSCNTTFVKTYHPHLSERPAIEALQMAEKCKSYWRVSDNETEGNHHRDRSMLLNMEF